MKGKDEGIRITLILSLFIFSWATAALAQEEFQNVEMSKNSNFSEGLKYWTILKEGPGGISVNVSNTIPIIHIVRKGADKQRGFAGIEQKFDPPLPARETTTFSIKFKINSHSLTNSGEWSKNPGELGDYPIHAYFYDDQGGVIFNIGFLPRDNRPDLPRNYLRKPIREWVFWDSQALVTKGKKISKLVIRAEGWDFDVELGRAALIGCDVIEKEPVSGGITIE